jgi:hypothetical protein
MVVRWKNKDGTGGVLTKPYTPEERRRIREISTWDHGGPYIRVGPRSAPPAVSSTNRHTEAPSQASPREQRK